MTSPITQLANRIRENRQIKLTEKQEQEKQEFLAIIKRLEDEFKIGFAEEIPLLEESGINWSAHLQDNRYEHMGAYILFEKDGKSVKMDFNHRKSYRYEFVPHSNHEHGARGSMVFGEWNKEDFYLFIDSNLLSK
jgi:hypothetical protein